MNLTAQKSATTNQNVWLWLVLVVTVALTAWTALTSPETDESLLAEPADNARTSATSDTIPQVKQSAVKPTANVATSSTWQIQHREALTEKTANLFPVHSWVVVAPITKTKPAPPPAPVAPPAPFVYMGKLEDGPKGTQIFLMANNKVYTVIKGEKVDAFWRLDGEDANQLLFTFLPLNLPQTLSKTQKLISAEPPSNTQMGQLGQ